MLAPPSGDPAIERVKTKATGTRAVAAKKWVNDWLLT